MSRQFSQGDLTVLLKYKRYNHEIADKIEVQDGFFIAVANALQNCECPILSRHLHHHLRQ